jgi:hypothetical protein
MAPSEGVGALTEFAATPKRLKLHEIGGTIQASRRTGEAMECGMDSNHILALAAVLAGLFAACGLLFLLAQLLSRFTHLRLQSLSLDDLLVLARSTNDRTDVIKEFYDWQHKLLLAVITGVIGFIAANIVLVVKAMVGREEATKAVAPFLDKWEVAAGFALVLVFLMFLTLSLLSRLARIPEEYRVSITLYERMR